MVIVAIFVSRIRQVSSSSWMGNMKVNCDLLWSTWKPYHGINCSLFLVTRLPFWTTCQMTLAEKDSAISVQVGLLKALKSSDELPEKLGETK